MHSYMQDYILCLCIIQVEAWALFQKISFISEEYVITIYLSIYLSIYPIQWCSGKFSLVGMLAWHYGHIPYRYQSGGGGGVVNSRVCSFEKIFKK